MRPGLVLGSMGDALAVFTRVPSVWARHQVTHVISLCNQKPVWMDELAPAEVEEEDGEEADGGGEEEEKEGKEGKGELPSLDEEPEGSDCVEEKKRNVRGKRRRRRRKKGELPRRRMFVQVADVPQSDLLHHFPSCCQFIKESRERGTVLVHW